MDDALQETIQEYRRMLKTTKPDLDIALLFRIFNLMNDSSEVHVAINPVTDEGDWSSSAPTYAVSGVTRLSDGRIALRVNSERHGITVDELSLMLRQELKRDSGATRPVLYVRNDEVTQLTDAYSHALVRDTWAGLPFDLVLAIKR